jgi:type VI secretion system protein ImpG
MPSEPDEPLLAHYLRELAYLHTSGAAFAHKYPLVAQALDFSEQGSADPHVERLIESFAFLTARLQRTHDAGFPEIPSALLGLLYPHLVCPTPSMSVASFLVDPQQSRSVAGVTVPAGTALFASAEAPLNDGAKLACWFRTGTPVTLWPIEVADAQLELRSMHGFLDADRRGADVQHVLRIRLRCLGNRQFGEISPASLRLHLPARGSSRGALYDLIFSAWQGLAIRPEHEREPRICDAGLAPVGFDDSEALIPSPAMSSQAFRLVQEYFAFPDKFLFFDLKNIPAGALGNGREADLLILLRTVPRGGMTVHGDSFALGCTPVINLFNRISEPIRLDHTQLDYRLVPDAAYESSTEIYTIDRVTRSRADGARADIIWPLFSLRHGDTGQPGRASYWARRQPGANPAYSGSDMVLAFVDPDLNLAVPAADTVFAHLTCTNRGIAEQIGAQTALHMETDLPLRAAICLNRPTPQIPAPSNGATLWRLVSHLSTNQLALAGNAEGLVALKNILLLYCNDGNETNRRRIAALTRMQSRRAVRHIGTDAWRGFCRGTEIEIEVDEPGFAGGSVYLMGAVLSRFLGLLAGMEAFTALAMTSPQRDEVWRWPAQSGNLFLH